MQPRVIWQEGDGRESPYCSWACLGAGGDENARPQWGSPPETVCCARCGRTILGASYHEAIEAAQRHAEALAEALRSAGMARVVEAAMRDPYLRAIARAHGYGQLFEELGIEWVLTPRGRQP